MSVVKSEQSTGTLFLRGLVPIAILVAGVGGFLAISNGLRQESGLESDRQQVPQVLVDAVRAHTSGMTIQADGVVVPYREIDVAAEVAGRIVKRADICRAGYYVLKGQLLVTIDPQDYQLVVDRLEQELEQAEVALKEWSEQIEGVERLVKIAVQELALRTREHERLQATERTAVSLSDLERVEGAKLAAENALETLRNRNQLLRVGQARLESARDLAELQLKKARLDLERTKVFAPADGVIVADFIEEDSYVQPGTPLLTLEDTAKAEVKCKLAMEDLYWLWDRQERAGSAGRSMPESSPDSADAAVAAAAYDIPDVEAEVVYRLAGHGSMEYIWRGRLQRYDGVGLDAKTRTVPCRVVVDRPRQRLPANQSGPPALLRGMYVEIRIDVTPKTPLLEIPEQGLQPGNLVWCVRDSKVMILPVNFISLRTTSDAGGSENRQALIYVDDTAPGGSASLKAGDEIVISTLDYVRTGMEVEVEGANQ